MIISLMFGDDDFDIVELPKEITQEKLCELHEEFFQWLFDKDNDHPFWVLQQGEKQYCDYRGDAFVYFLNQYDKFSPEISRLKQSFVEVAEGDYYLEF